MNMLGGDNMTERKYATNLRESQDSTLLSANALACGIGCLCPDPEPSCQQQYGLVYKMSRVRYQTNKGKMMNSSL